MSIPDPRDFLAELAAYLKAELGLTADRAPRLATVDPAYSGTGKPHVTFDGDTAMAEKSLPYLAGLTLSGLAGQRVLCLPVGNTYVIVDKVLNT